MLHFSDIRRIICFFAHPDDETLAAGATIAKLANKGVDVHIAIPATGLSARRELDKTDSGQAAIGKLRSNCEKAMKILDVPAQNIYFGEFSDNEMDKHTLLELIHWLENIIDKINPSAIFTHHRYCTNIDHQYCHEAAIVATRPNTRSHIALLCGEVPSSTGYLKPVQWEPNYYVEINEKDLEKKVEAMKAYDSETRPDPHPRSSEVLRALAKVRGSESGFLFAESFMLQRAFG